MYRKFLTAATVVVLLVGIGGPVRAAAQAPVKPSNEASEPSAEVRKDLEILSLHAQLASLTKQVSDLQAEIGACQAQLGPLQFDQNRVAWLAEQKAITEKYEKERPGWTLDAGGKPVKKAEPEKPKS